MTLRARLKALEGSAASTSLIGLAERMRRRQQWMRANPSTGVPVPETGPMLRRRLEQLKPGGLAQKMAAQRLHNMELSK